MSGVLDILVLAHNTPVISVSWPFSRVPCLEYSTYSSQHTQRTTHVNHSQHPQIQRTQVLISRFSDTAGYWPQIVDFNLITCTLCPCWGDLDLNFNKIFGVRKYSPSAILRQCFRDLCLAVLVELRIVTDTQTEGETDRQTDRHTDRRTDRQATAYTVLVQHHTVTCRFVSKFGHLATCQFDILSFPESRSMRHHKVLLLHRAVCHQPYQGQVLHLSARHCNNVQGV